MLKNSVPLVQALETLSHQVEFPQLGEVIRNLAEKVSQGHPFSQQLAQFPRIFSRVYVTMVQIGERTGNLDDCLDRVALWQERDEQLRRKIQSALTYPLFVIGLTLCLTLFMFYTVLPNFLTIFKEMNLPLPLITRVIMFLTEALRQPGTWLFLICSLFLGLSLGKQAWQKTAVQILVWRALGRVPILGDMLLKGSCARYCLSAEAMLATGMDLSTSLRLAAQCSANPLFIEDAVELERSVTEGIQVSSHLAARPDIYPNAMTQMVTAGEQASQLPEMYGRVGALYDMETCFSIDTLSAAMEPLLLGTVAGMVGTVILSVFIPLYSFIGNF